MSFDEFDQSIGRGWRELEKEGCYTEAAELLSTYRTTRTDISDSQRSILLWHEGQARAFGGDSRKAVPLMLAGVPVNDDGSFTEYALGTVAFLKHDLKGLKAARKRLASLPKPVDWVDEARVMIDGKEVVVRDPWPPNLAVLDALILCFGKPYIEAYRCRTGSHRPRR